MMKNNEYQEVAYGAKNYPSLEAPLYFFKSVEWRMIFLVSSLSMLGILTFKVKWLLKK